MKPPIDEKKAQATESAVESPLKLTEKKNKEGVVIERFYLDPKQQLESTFEKFSDDGKVVTFKANYVAGKLQGPVEMFDNEGNLTQKVNYEMGALNGDSLSYKKGELFIKCTFVQGKKEGPMYIYYEDGNLMLKQFYVQDKLNGPYVYHHMGTEKIAKTCTYLAGKIQGECLEYYPEGQIMRKSFYLNGKLEGEVTTYAPNGDVHQRQFYHLGKMLLGKQAEEAAAKSKEPPKGA